MADKDKKTPKLEEDPFAAIKALKNWDSDKEVSERNKYTSAPSEKKIKRTKYIKTLNILFIDSENLRHKTYYMKIKDFDIDKINYKKLISILQNAIPENSDSKIEFIGRDAEFKSKDIAISEYDKDQMGVYVYNTIRDIDALKVIIKKDYKNWSISYFKNVDDIDYDLIDLDELASIVEEEPPNTARNTSPPVKMPDGDETPLESKIQSRFSVAADAEAVGKMLTVAREQAGVTKSEVARRMNTGHRAIAKLENGDHSPSLQTVERFANALGYEARIDFVLKPESK